MDISPARYGASLQGKLDGVGQEQLDAAHRDHDVQAILSWLDRGTHQIDHRVQRWFCKEELDAVPIPSPHRRAINALLL